MAQYRLALSFYKALTRLRREQQRHVLMVLDHYLADPSAGRVRQQPSSDQSERRWHIAVHGGLEIVLLRDRDFDTFVDVDGPSRLHSARQQSQPQEDVNLRSDTLSAEQLRSLLETDPVDWGWLLFLSRQQRQAVHRRFNGVARISGAAGTGKTVVALHRVAELANRNPLLGADEPSILVTSYVKDVPQDLEERYNLLPNAVAGRVEFIHVDLLVKRTLDDIKGEQPRACEDKAAEGILRRIRYPGSCVPATRSLSNLSDGDLVTEFERTIRGRQIRTLNRYLSLRCRGRERAFDETTGEAIWRLYERYHQELKHRKQVTFAHRVNMALAALGQKFDPYYDSAVIDEVQDFTLAQLQFVRALVNGGTAAPDRVDGLLMVGDGAQRMYSGGFKLNEAGIDIRGNAMVFQRNYRSTEQIVQASRAVTGKFEVEDLDSSYRRGEQTISTTRSGLKPRLVEACDLPDQAAYVVRLVREYMAVSASSEPDVGILATEKRHVELVAAQLRAANIAHRELTNQTPYVSKGVRVTTIHRARNFESTVVFVVGLCAERWPLLDDVTAEHARTARHRERSALHAGVLHVATQRAREALYLLFDGDLLPLTEAELARFELVKTDCVIRRNRDERQGAAVEPF